MKTLEELMTDVSQLTLEEKKCLLQQLQQELSDDSMEWLDCYIGVAHGLWEQDAQKYVDQLRQDDRI